MKKVIKIIIISILIGFVAFPTITLGGTFVSSLIQGKTVKEAIEILAGQIDSLIGRVATLESKQSVLEKKVYCSELIQHTPDRGFQQWINADIVGFYQSSLERLEELKNNPSRPGQQADFDWWQKLVNEAKPLYDNYIEKCGEK